MKKVSKSAKKSRRKFCVVLDLSEIEYNYVRGSLMDQVRQREDEIILQRHRHGKTLGNIEDLQHISKRTLRKIEREQERQLRAWMGEAKWKETRRYVNGLIRKQLRREATHQPNNG